MTDSEIEVAANFSRRARLAWLFGALALAVIAAVLRPPVAVIGPLLHEMQLAVPLSVAETAFLASAPVFCFGIGAFFGPYLVGRLGLDRSMLLVLLVQLASMLLRLFGGVAWLLAGTIGIGLAIAVANVLLPTVVRTAYRHHVTLATGLYTTMLAISASLAASSAVPLAHDLGGWEGVLLVWVVPVVIGALFWWAHMHFKRAPGAGRAGEVQPTAAGEVGPTAAGDSDPGSDKSSARTERRMVLRSPIAWALVVFFGLQSLGFYAILAWMPKAFIAAGLSEATAGQLLGFSTIVGVPIGLLATSLLRKAKSLAFWAALASLVTATGFALLFFDLARPDATLAQRAMLAGGLICAGQACTFPISLALIGSRASSMRQTTALSALSQGWGYLFAGLGTFAVGMLAEATGSFVSAMLTLAAVSMLQAVAGYFSGRPGQIALH